MRGCITELPLFSNFYFILHCLSYLAIILKVSTNFGNFIITTILWEPEEGKKWFLLVSQSLWVFLYSPNVSLALVQRIGEIILSCSPRRQARYVARIKLRFIVIGIQFTDLRDPVSVVNMSVPTDFYLLNGLFQGLMSTR